MMLNTKSRLSNNNEWSKYYTPVDVADRILAKIPVDFVPAQVVDICVGSGNFLDVASRKWKNADLIGVDLSLEGICNKKFENYKLHEFDALNLKKLNTIFRTSIGDKPRLILANPPFGKLLQTSTYQNQSSQYPYIHKAAINIKRIEALMLVSNINILRKGDYFGAVLPNNFFQSDSFRSFKQFFMDLFDNIFIGKTDRYFKQTEVKTRIFIARFKGKSFIDKSGPHFLDKKEYDLELYRGINNSKLITDDKKKADKKYTEVLHFNNPAGLIHTERYIEKNTLLKKFKVEAGDTLILRVGRHAGQTFRSKIAYRRKFVSDYFYLLKGITLNNSQHLIFQKLLKKKRRGMTAYYLSKEDIMTCLSTILKLEGKSDKPCG